MLLIAFCGNFCSFCKANHAKVFELARSQQIQANTKLNSELQVRSQRKVEQKAEERGTLQNFAGCEIHNLLSVSKILTQLTPFDLFL